MASTPGILTDWPWTPLGSFKYVVLAPWAIHSAYSFMGKATIIDKGLEFEQVDRERNWDDQIIFNGMLFYLGRFLAKCVLPRAKTEIPLWKGDGFVMTMLLHAGPVEYLYYWLHRALHHHFLYSRYHSHHHSSIVTEPITSVTHPFAEHITYFMLFAIPMVATLLIGTASITSYFFYITYIDFMNNMGHCNFEFIPTWIFSIFPPLKYLLYTSSYHSLHHTQFRTNYSLFMPIYDYIYGTMDKSSDALYESSLKKDDDIVVHDANSDFGRSFVIERQHFDNKLRLQTWVIPKYSLQYVLSGQTEAINKLIEQAILEAEEKGVKVISLGLLNQGEGLNSYGGIYVQRNPQLKIKVVDGSSLVVAVILNSIPKGTTQVLITGKLTKIAYALVFSLWQRNIQVATSQEAEYLKLTKSLSSGEGMLVHDRSYAQKIWLVGDELSKKEQLSAPKGTIFVPFFQFPPKQLRKDCYYHCTPAMKIPKSLENVYSCENWLPRRVMSAWRIAGIVYALEGWNEHECGHTMSINDKVWEATLRHGFQPLIITTQTKN
ncbi:hypothetical protein M0R45_027156 [Rubus argutus]|uniref:Uncharacterized protein n=1 Tax=Rubus argutus TaxID=59490 RepID=A0AAW1X008_RUBAR